jgi:hypothetical protein
MAIHGNKEIMRDKNLRLAICAQMESHIREGNSLQMASSLSGVSANKIYKYCKLFEEFDRLRDIVSDVRRKKDVKSVYFR